ncbi:hypothetical protein B0J12DRAFT_37203 [Macrophomina phaseolina]|uniref:Uncharacterized protein n=1 Tax=Macrophomina phaseolina TaxID=35725 RepID=A0ABQ8GW55_9PEZI|nr:hypothetical protein B0J12DRAFT_37203 [Macrophomina phaseolina]
MVATREIDGQQVFWGYGCPKREFHAGVRRQKQTQQRHVFLAISHVTGQVPSWRNEADCEMRPSRMLWPRGIRYRLRRHIRGWRIAAGAAGLVRIAPGSSTHRKREQWPGCSAPSRRGLRSPASSRNGSADLRQMAGLGGGPGESRWPELTKAASCGKAKGWRNMVADAEAARKDSGVSQGSGGQWSPGGSLAPEPSAGRAAEERAAREVGRREQGGRGGETATSSSSGEAAVGRDLDSQITLQPAAPKTAAPPPSAFAAPALLVCRQASIVQRQSSSALAPPPLPSPPGGPPRPRWSQRVPRRHSIISTRHPCRARHHQARRTRLLHAHSSRHFCPSLACPPAKAA